jgi:hypothetical protein
MENNDSIEPQSDSKRARIEVSLANMSTDPYLRKIIYDYHPNDRDNIRRAYLQQQQQKKKKKKKKKKPCQPFDHNFSQTQFGKTSHRFNKAWFKEHSDWLEYSILKDTAYCLYCYLFKPNTRNQAGGDLFVTEGFKNWKKKDKL